LSLVTLFVSLFIASAMLTGLFRLIAVRISLIDQPVSRSAHSSPIPVGGGISIVILYCLMVLYLAIFTAIPSNELLLLLASIPVAAVGLLDDFWQLDIKWRVPVQFLAAFWAIWMLGGVPAISFSLWSLENVWILSILAALALVWLLNLYNFMDGIDGLAGSELVFVNAMTYLFVMNSGDQMLQHLSILFIASGLGFLVWNWAPARVFMGDVGSSFMGFSLGLMALLSMHHGSMTVWAWVLLLGVFIVDATLTLSRRFIKGEKWYEGHSSHAYQNAARCYKSHRKVTITVLLINCFWLAPLAWLAMQNQDLGIIFAMIGLLPLVILALRYKAGTQAF
jgi:Fuc2NAc and GlcNAc transferase